MEKLQFRAKVVYGSKETANKYYMVGLADEKFDTKNYFIAQRSYDGEDEDTEQIYFEYSINNGEYYNAQYDICEKLTLTKDKVIIKIKGDGIIEIDITGAGINTSFIDYMNTVFEGLFEIEYI